jgi:hypothetical protein
MGRVCHGVDLEYGTESQAPVRLSIAQETWLTESVDAMEQGAAPMIVGPAVRRALERRFAANFAALSEDEWAQVAARGLTAAMSAGRIAAQLAELDNSREIRRRHALAGLQAVRAICDRTMSLSRLAERRERPVSVRRSTDREAIRIAS